MRYLLGLGLLGLIVSSAVHAETQDATCPRPPAGSVVSEPVDLRSVNGVLKVELRVRNALEGGSLRYCYLLPDGSQSPTLRLHPGDLLVLRLKNELKTLDAGAAPERAHDHSPKGPAGNPCTSGVMSLTATNLHFHGMNLAPVCHQDEVLKTSVQPGDAPFEYRFRVPRNQPPGLYWYHPHIHGFSRTQVLGGPRVHSSLKDWSA